MIERFYVRGQGHSPLSNFSAHPIAAPIQGGIVPVMWPTVEHYYQAMKSTSRLDQDAILTCGPAKEAKRLGRQVSLRPDWEWVKFKVMRFALKRKFTRISEPGLFLLDTGNQFLIEGNDWGDRVWGCVQDQDGEWVGENWLGHLLMARRDELRSDFGTPDAA